MVLLTSFCFDAVLLCVLLLTSFCFDAVLLCVLLLIVFCVDMLIVSRSLSYGKSCADY